MMQTDLLTNASSSFDTNYLLSVIAIHNQNFVPHVEGLVMLPGDDL